MPEKLGCWLFGEPSIIFNRVSALNEIYVTKNQYHTKHENERLFGEPLLLNNIVSMDTANPAYKSKRKTLSSAFFKNKIRALMDLVKYTSLKYFKDIQDRANADGATELDLNKTTSTLQNHIITNVMLGEGASYAKLEWTDLDDSIRQVELAEYIDLILESFFLRINDNPLFLLVPTLATKQLTNADRKFFKNTAVMRDHIRQIIVDRQKGKTGGLAVGEQKDIISMLVEDDSYKDSIDDIIDEVIVMFIAGTKTVQGTTTNLLGLYCNTPEFKEKLHKDMDPLVEKVQHDWVKAYEFEMTEELEYLKWAYYEVMRYDTPIAISSTSTVT
jgi:cytochrome P450